MNEASQKSYAVAVCLSMIFGVMGIHLFYLGRYLEGLFDLGLFLVSIYFFMTGQFTLAVIAFLIDFAHTFIITIMLFVGTFKDGNGKIVTYPGQKLN